MKTIRLLALATLLLPAFTGTVVARFVVSWPYQELLEKSDLVVIATPTASTDTKEHIQHPNFAGQQVIGLETKFTILTVLKGDKTLKDFIFHHYRTPDGSNLSNVPNGPSFISFAPVISGYVKNPTLPPRTYILFLIKEADGRYAPVVGQTDPGGAVRELR